MSAEERIYNSMPAVLRTALMNAHAVRIARHRYGRGYRELLEEFYSLATASPDQIRNYQLRMLKRQLHVAVSAVPFYSERLSSTEIDRADDPYSLLRRFPVIGKDDVRADLARLLNTTASRRHWLHGHTSGTTGSPLSLWYDRAVCFATNAADRLQKRIAGVADDEWIGMLLGRQVVPSRIRAAPFWHANFIQRQVWFSSLHMRPETMDDYVHEIRRRGLRVLEGYPSTLFVLASHLLRSGKTLPMKAVFSSSESLHETQREAIEQAFCTSLFDYYGHAERVIFAVECAAHAGKHLIDPFGVTEVVDESGVALADGKLGYLTGTSLHNSAMPLVRYRTGDLSAIDRTPCACGVNFPRISGVSTKAEDIVVLPDGRWLSPSALTHPFKPFPAIVRSQLIQEATDRFLIKIVADSAFNESAERDLLDRLRERLGAGVSIEIQRVMDIPAEQSGKFRWVISKVPHNLRLMWT